MKLALQLSIGLAVGILVVLSVAAAIGLRGHMQWIERDVRQDHSLLSRRLASVVEGAWRLSGSDDVLEILRDDERNESQIETRWRWLDDSVRGEPALSPELQARLREGAPVSFAIVDGDGIETRYTLLPVRTPDGRSGAVEIRERLLRESAYVGRAIWHVALAIAAAVAVCGGLALWLGVVRIGRPVRALIAKARRIGAGDLSGEIVLQQRDELGELAWEMNAMCRQLAEAREHAACEAMGRISAIAQLRHADRLTTVGKLASGIAHELGTPIAIVTGRADLIMDSHPAGSAAHDNAALILDQARRMATIIRQLLDFARSRPTRRAVHDVGSIIGQTLRLLSTLADRYHVEMETAGPGPVVWNLDAFQIQQALTNLVINGIQAMPQGGKLVVGYELQRSPRQSMAGNGQVLHLFVCDEGIGMPRDVMDHVFEPFFTTKGIGEGTGLGLSVAYGIVRDHGGWIDVESEVGKGSRFSVWLPNGDAA